MRGFYFIGDSAYTLKSFLLTPFDGVMHGSEEDNFNFFHSSSRICVECAFGEIDLRWGILWRPLRFSLKNNIKIIDACMRLHNFIVDFREAIFLSTMSPIDRDVFDEDCRRFLAVQSGVVRPGVHSGEEEVRLGGRPSTVEQVTSEEGRALRKKVCEHVADQDCTRPPANWYRQSNRVLD